MAELAGYAPLRIRVGVTGHRVLADEPAIGAAVDDILSRLQRRLPSSQVTSVLFEVVSPLGEGADRIVAERVLRLPGATLEAPLPLPEADYEQDFASEGSRRRFHELLDRASRVWVVGGSDRIDAYERAGVYVVESCDVLIAIWDQQPSRGAGGTREILDLARRRRMPAFVIDSGSPSDVAEERLPVLFELFQDVERYNGIQLSGAADRSPGLLPPSVADGGGSDFAPYRSWAEPGFRRADAIANRYRGRFLAFSRTMFLLSAFATIAAAVSVVAHGEDTTRGFAYLEVALMVAALALWLSVRRRLHGRWITSRFLAERLRSAAFLAYLGTGRVMESTPVGAYRGNAQEWLSRVIREVWRSRPQAPPTDRAVERVKDLLRLAWVDPQVDYYRRRSASHGTAFRLLAAASGALLAGAIAAAALHASARLNETLSPAVEILSIGLPALAGALMGIAGLEQHARQADRFGLMHRRLVELRDDLERATTIERVGQIATRIESELRTEGDAWIDVMRYQDIEFPAR